jgi:hypothetical protein
VFGAAAAPLAGGVRGLQGTAWGDAFRSLARGGTRRRDARARRPRLAPALMSDLLHALRAGERFTYPVSPQDSTVRQSLEQIDTLLARPPLTDAAFER